MSMPTTHPAAATLASSEPADGTSMRFAKTEAGRLEIRLRAVPLLRPARNLLLIIDSSRSAAEWIALVQGCDRAALQELQDAGLVANAGTTGAGIPGMPAPESSGATSAPALTDAATALPRMSTAQALEQRSYSALYDRITAEARPRLGLIKAYKLIMEVEHCSGPSEIRAVAQRFIDQVRELKGDSAGKALAQVLVAPE